MGTVIAKSRFRNVNAIEYNGSTQYAFRTNPSFKSDQAGAFAGWVRLATLLSSDGNKGVIGYGVENGSDNRMVHVLRQFRIPATSSQNRFNNTTRVVNAGAVTSLYGNTALAAATWYHVVVSSSGSTTRIYVNGSAQTLTGTNTGVWLGDIGGTNHRLTFGCTFSSNAPVTYNDCRCDEWIYVSGRELTAGEVSEHYNSGTPLNPRRLSFRSDIVSWWRFGDSRDDGSTVYDEIGSNDLTLVSSPGYVAV